MLDVILPLCILLYFMMLYAVSHAVSKNSGGSAFYRGDRQSPWYMVAFGMVGASISGVTFVSVPGMVLHSDMTYLQTCMGFILGYFVVAFVLLPIYYRLNLTSIYTYLQRAGSEAYKTGASFFILSKLLGSAAKFYVPCFIVSHMLECSFPLTVCALLIPIWLYTRKSGIKALVWTDTLQTFFMLAALLLILYNVYTELTNGTDAMTTTEVASNVWHSSYSRVFNFSDWNSSSHFLKCFISGIFIVIVMTGLDQDMMQKNLTCRSLHDAQKDMCTYGFAFVPVNALFLVLGVMLTMLLAKNGMPLPERADELLTQFATSPQLSSVIVPCAFLLGIIATSFSTIDSALTALTTSFCIDLQHKHSEDDTKHRSRVHLAMTFAMAICCILFDQLNSTSLIDAIYKLVSYTYGPLLGLFAYAMLFPKQPSKRKGCVAAICILSPLLCLALDHFFPIFTGYHFGYELLLINGLLTFTALWSLYRIERL